MAMTASDDVNVLSLENELTAYVLEQAHPLVKPGGAIILQRIYAPGDGRVRCAHDRR